MTHRKVVIRSLAESDLDDIWDYVALDNIEQAEKLIGKFGIKLQNLAESPYMGRNREELMQDLRSFPLGAYVIFYRPTKDGIEVIRVLHSARDTEDIFAGMDEDNIQ
jgi:toxin ParE1/3/4